MPITPINQSKNTISPINSAKGAGAYWADSVASWADTFFGWADVTSVTNNSKNSISPTNITKN